MCAQMFTQVSVLTEALATHLTRKGPLPSMDPLMQSYSRGGHKLFPTNRTLMSFRTFACGAAGPSRTHSKVAEFVKPEISKRIEFLSTYVTILASSNNYQLSWQCLRCGGC